MHAQLILAVIAAAQQVLASITCDAKGNVTRADRPRYESAMFEIQSATEGTRDMRGVLETESLIAVGALLAAVVLLVVIDAWRTGAHAPSMSGPTRYAWPSFLLVALDCGDSEDRAGDSTTSTSTSGTAAVTTGIGGGGGEGGSGGANATALDPTRTRVSSPLTEGRSHHTSTLLPDGRVVVIGGESATGEPLASVEVFDVATETWSALPALPDGRANHTTTALPGGELLIVGGARSNANGSPSPDDVRDTAILYDPSGAGVVTEIALGAPRGGHHALPLPDGDILVVGGSNDTPGSACTSVPDCHYGKALATSERFDVEARTFSAAGSMAGPRMLFGAVTLRDGSPLVVGGATDTTSLARVERFDPSLMSFVEEAPLANARLRPVVVSLGDGAVLAVAGKVANVGPVGVTEIYDPLMRQWMDGPELAVPRTGAAAVTLQSGNALIVGGFDQTTGDELDEILIFDAATRAWVHLPPLSVPRALPTATILGDGRVLVVGGSGGLASTEITE